MLAPREILVCGPGILAFLRDGVLSGCCFAEAKIFPMPLSFFWSCALMYLGETFAFQSLIAVLLTTSEKVSLPIGCCWLTR